MPRRGKSSRTKTHLRAKTFGKKVVEKPNKKESAETQRRREILKETHELQRLEIERQVWEEESERGGYLPLDDAVMNAVASIKNVSWKQNVKAEPISGCHETALFLEVNVYQDK